MIDGVASMVGSIRCQQCGHWPESKPYYAGTVTICGECGASFLVRFKEDGGGGYRWSTELFTPSDKPVSQVWKYDPRYPVGSPEARVPGFYWVRVRGGETEWEPAEFAELLWWTCGTDVPKCDEDLEEYRGPYTPPWEAK